MGSGRRRAVTDLCDTRDTCGFTAGPGAILANRYEILEYVGKGGMGVVYKAHDRTLDETVAIKILRQQPIDDGLI